MLKAGKEFFLKLGLVLVSLTGKDASRSCHHFDLCLIIAQFVVQFSLSRKHSRTLVAYDLEESGRVGVVEASGETQEEGMTLLVTSVGIRLSNNLRRLAGTSA